MKTTNKKIVQLFGNNIVDEFSASEICVHRVKNVSLETDNNVLSNQNISVKTIRIESQDCKGNIVTTIVKLFCDNKTEVKE